MHIRLDRAIGKTEVAVGNRHLGDLDLRRMSGGAGGSRRLCERGRRSPGGQRHRHEIERLVLVNNHPGIRPRHRHLGQHNAELRCGADLEAVERDCRESGQFLRARAAHQTELLHAHIPFQGDGRLAIGEIELHLAGHRNRALGEAGIDKLLEVGAEGENRQVRGVGFECRPDAWIDRYAAHDLQGALRSPGQRQLQWHHGSSLQGHVLQRALQFA